MKADTEKSANDHSYYTFTFDLEKSLLVPKLTCLLAYYKRNLYVYNLGCHELSSKLGFMCLDKVNGSKGSQEIAACLVKHIEARARLANHVVMYIDETLMRLVQSEDNNIEVIDQKFMQSGHSYLPNGCNFASIENFSRMQQIFTPNVWYSVQKKIHFMLLSCQTMIFFLLKTYFKKSPKEKKDSEGHLVSWLKMQWIWYKKSEPFSILFKETLSEEMPFSKLNNMPGSQKGRPVNIRNISLEKLYGLRRSTACHKRKEKRHGRPFAIHCPPPSSLLQEPGFQ